MYRDVLQHFVHRIAAELEKAGMGVCNGFCPMLMRCCLYLALESSTALVLHIDICTGQNAAKPYQTLCFLCMQVHDDTSGKPKCVLC